MQRYKLGELVRISAGLNPRSLGASGGAEQFRLISIKDVNQRLAPSVELATLSTDRRSIERFQVFPDDVVVTTRGTTIRAAVVEDSHAGAIAGANLAIIRMSESLRPALLAAFLREPQTQALLLRGTAGASTPGFTIKALGALEIRIPATERQSTLVEFLAAADAHREALTRAMDLRQQVCNRIIAQALVPAGGT